MTTITLGNGQNQDWTSGVLTRTVKDGTTNNLRLLAKATGGTITYSGGYIIHTFTSTADFTPAGSMTIDILVVAGGGGGGPGNGGGGGGGGGGVVYATSYAVTGKAYAATIGGGGNGGSGAGGSGTVGSNSTFDAITAIGGGAGKDNAGTKDGGCGAGGTGGNAGGAATQGDSGGGKGYGFAGGKAVYVAPAYGGGGGGGAGAIGADGTSAAGGKGGDGHQNTISGSNVYYAAGGGGGSNNAGAAGAGGTGGGGAGGGAAVGSAATANTGSGGGGGGSGYNSGGKGAAGIVVIRYLGAANYVASGTHSVIMDLGAGILPDTMAWSSIEDPTAGAAVVEINTVQYADPKTISIRGSDTAPSGAAAGTFNDSDVIAHDYWTTWGTTSPEAWEEITNGGSISTTVYRYVEIRETLRNNN